MIGLLSKHRYSPIGVDFGTRSIKLIQFDGQRSTLVEAVRWDLPADMAAADSASRKKILTEAIRAAMAGRSFHGRSAVICLGGHELSIQNIRFPKVPRDELAKLVQQETSSRFPYPADEAEIRFLEAADVRQGDSVRRELIVLACHRPALDEKLEILVEAGLQPVAVDAEPNALLRCYVQQYRRDEDRMQRTMFVHVGGTQTAVLIAEGDRVLFVKYLDIGGRHMDEAVAERLKMSLEDAEALRRHNGDRRADQQDPEIARSIAESVRAVIDQLANEAAMCVRYHSVTFRGQPLARMVVCGGEATPALAEALGSRLSLKSDLGDPLRSFQSSIHTGRKSQWDVATGLALREVTAP